MELRFPLGQSGEATFLPSVCGVKPVTIIYKHVWNSSCFEKHFYHLTYQVTFDSMRSEEIFNVTLWKANNCYENLVTEPAYLLSHHAETYITIGEDRDREELGWVPRRVLGTFVLLVLVGLLFFLRFA